MQESQNSDFSPHRPIDDEPVKEVEFSLFETLQRIYNGRKKIIRFTFIGLIIGVLFSFLFNPNEYRTGAVILPVNSAVESGASGLLKQFGRLGGISIGGSSSAENIPPTLYPNIVSSTPFLIYISEQQINIEKSDTSVSVFQYFNYYHNGGLASFLMEWTFGLPDKIMGVFRSSNRESDSLISLNSSTPIKLTKKQLGVINILRDRISVDLDEEIGVVSLRVTMPEPKIAAEIAAITLTYLTDYSVAYKTDKERATMEFIEGRYQEARTRFYEAQESLALFNDRNQNLALAKSQAEKERLESEYNLTFNLYNGLAQQLEEARIKVQQNMPAFKILEPVQVPVNKSSPRKLSIIIVFGFISLFIGVFRILYGAYLNKFFKQIISQS